MPNETPEAAALLRPHVINLTQGQLSSSGEFTTTPADVADIFGRHLPAYADERGGTVPVLLYAHGGLVSERSGLDAAAELVQWWRDIGVYPVYFVWESGLADALKGLLPGGRRGLLEDRLNEGIERVARTLGGPAIWGGMKRSAERASAPGGGARLALEHLRDYQKTRPQTPIHLVGHSAGSIFHAHVLTAARGIGLGPFATLQLLAPAVTIATFEDLVLPHVGPGAAVGSLAVFTMTTENEEADNCWQVYRRSLLCLVKAALETHRDTPLLGLQEDIRANTHLTKLFQEPFGRLVLSTSADGPPGSRSTSRTHGGFDNDAPTMESVAFRVLGAAPGRPFPEATTRVAADVWDGPRADELLQPAAGPAPAGAGASRLRHDPPGT